MQWESNTFLTKGGKNYSSAKQEINRSGEQNTAKCVFVELSKIVTRKVEHKWQCEFTQRAQAACRSCDKQSLLTHSAIVYPGRVQNASPEVTLCFTNICKLTNIIQAFSILCTTLSAAHQLWYEPTETDFSFFPPSLPHFVVCFMYQFLPPLRTHFLSFFAFFLFFSFTYGLFTSTPFLSQFLTPLLSFYSRAYLVHLSFFPVSAHHLLNLPHRPNWVFTSSLD